MKKIYLTVASVACSLAILLTGCSSAQTPKEGTLVLSLNPQIEFRYDEQGNVTSLIGLNKDGQAMVDEYEFEGKDCETALNDAMTKIKSTGYLDDTIDGKKRNVVLQLMPGSYLPSGSFLGDLEDILGTHVSEKERIVIIDSDDYDTNYQDNTYISLDKAKEIALTQAKVDASKAQFSEKEFDFDDGLAIYELEFTIDGVEYKYDVDARTGVVVAGHNSKDIPKDDTDYGPLNDGVTDYHSTDYGKDSDGVTDVGNSDYGPYSDGITDYDDTDYGPLNDGVTDYEQTDYNAPVQQQAPTSNTTPSAPAVQAPVQQQTPTVNTTPPANSGGSGGGSYNNSDYGDNSNYGGNSG